MMEVVDYDLVEMTKEVIKYLSDGNNMSELDRYCLSVLHSKAKDGKFTTDGEILARALKEYGLGLLRCMTQMRLYDSSGKLLYRFQSLVSSTILLEPIG
ncbi:hypothetical protein D3C80_1365400 [compost metagenome]